MSTQFLQRTCMRNNHRMHTLFPYPWIIISLTEEMTCNHKIIPASSEGNRLKLEVSHVTITFSQHDFFFKYIKMAQRQNQILSWARGRLDSNWIGKKCVSRLSDSNARVKTITIGILFHNQSIRIKQFIWLNTHFMQFYWTSFHGTCGISTIHLNF